MVGEASLAQRSVISGVTWPIRAISAGSPIPPLKLVNSVVGVCRMLDTDTVMSSPRQGQVSAPPGPGRRTHLALSRRAHDRVRVEHSTHSNNAVHQFKLGRSRTRHPTLARPRQPNDDSRLRQPSGIAFAGRETAGRLLMPALE